MEIKNFAIITINISFFCSLLAMPPKLQPPKQNQQKFVPQNLPKNQPAPAPVKKPTPPNPAALNRKIVYQLYLQKNAGKK